MDSVRPSPLEPGYRIERYELLYVIAEGGMGAVWAARLQGKHGFQKFFAIKTILPRFASDKSFRTMFLDEARIASAIEHPNVAQIFDLGEQHDVPYIVMEYVDGDSLNRLHKLAEKTPEQHIPYAVALRIMADTCAGLHAAHELLGSDGALAEVVHRDVSPQNILVSTTGLTKLIDFGVAKARDRLAGETSGAVLKGKVRYIAPEQVLGTNVDRRADVWGIGAVLQLLFTGEAALPGDSDMAILRELISGGAVRALPAEVPRPVAQVVQRALQRDPADRYPTALAMQQAIEAAMIASNLHCSAAEVGAYVAERTKKRIVARREALQLALGAVSERARVREALEKPAGDSDSEPRSHEAVSDNRPEVSPRLPGPARTGVATPVEPADSPSQIFFDAQVPIEVSTGATLVERETSVVHELDRQPLPGRRRTGRLAIAGGLAICTLIGAAVVVRSLTQSTPPPMASERGAEPPPRAAVPAPDPAPESATPLTPATGTVVAAEPARPADEAPVRKTPVPTRRGAAAVVAPRASAPPPSAATAARPSGDIGSTIDSRQ